MTRWHQAPEVLDAAAVWKNRCLLQDGSVFTDRSLWTRENLDLLDRYFVKNLDYGDGTFYPKLKAQLAPAAPGAKQLAAEMLWAMFLFISHKAMGGATKRLQIKEVWEWSGDTLPEGEALGAVLEVGTGHTGTAYNTHRWRELEFFISAMRVWKALPSTEQRRLLGVPWDFAAWLDSIPTSKNRQLREILLYLLFPNDFERSSTGRDKRAIVREFLKKEKKDPDAFAYGDRILLDKEVKRIRETWSGELGGDEFDFYKKAAKVVWQESPGDPPASPVPSPEPEALDRWYQTTFGGHRVFTIAAGAGGRWWPDFQQERIVAVSWPLIGDLSAYESRGAIRAAMVEPGKPDRDPIHDSLAAWNFAHVMQPGDHVLVTAGRRELLGHAIIASEYSFDEQRPEAQHLRRVEWKRTGIWNLPEEHQVSGKTLTDLESSKAWLRVAWDLMHGKQPPPSTTDPTSGYTLDDAMEDVFMSRDTFERIVDVLATKKNVILEGAPGVGKTFLARRIAWTLMRSRDNARVEMVQFHQSYAYEDFVQGWRPDGKGFRLQNGVFHRFCDRARKAPDQAFVFIIDEINRGNLSKVLGELMLLIEHDKRGDSFAIPLTYSQEDGERFSVPANVHLLGLMNTADRSLAMVDYALRRRFAFFRVEPGFESEAFTEVLTKRGVPEALVGRIRKAMSGLNKDITGDRDGLGPGFEIGHSFFVPSDGTDAFDDGWYKSIILGEIEPLLREYWFDQPERVSNAVKDLLG